MAISLLSVNLLFRYYIHIVIPTVCCPTSLLRYCLPPSLLAQFSLISHKDCREQIGLARLLSHGAIVLLAR